MDGVKLFVFKYHLCWCQHFCQKMYHTYLKGHWQDALSLKPWDDTCRQWRDGSKKAWKLINFTPLHSNKKWKRNKNLKVPSFCAVFNCSNHADKEKDKSNYRFPKSVKNNGKEGFKLLTVRREKWSTQIFRKYLREISERKLERTRKRIKLMLSASPTSVFSHKVHNIWFEKQICILF